MKATKRINVEVLSKKLMQTISTVQYVTGLQIVMSVKDFDIPAGTTAKAFFEKPSKKFVYQDAVISGNDITIDVNNQALTEYGSVYYQVRLTNGDDIITTFSGKIDVEKSLADNSATSSETIVPAFDSAVQKAVKEIESARDSAIQFIGNGLDSTLTTEGKAADAAATGKAVAELKGDLVNITDDFNTENNCLKSNITELRNSEDKFNTLMHNVVRVKDQYSDELLTEDGRNIIYNIYGVHTDSSFSSEGIPADAMAVGKKFKEITYGHFHEYGLPTLYLYGDTSLMTKENRVTLDYIYGNLSGVCTCKWQGSSSLAFPKKNYTIVFDNPFLAKSGWGEQRKYCFKANFIDSSNARNLVSNFLWQKIVHDRGTKQSMPTDIYAPFSGAIDGFPCIIFINENFQGIYTFNMPKDAWTFGITDGNCAVLNANNADNSVCRFMATTTTQEIADESTFALEVNTDAFEVDDVATSINKVLSICANASGSDYKDSLSPYISIDSAIDYMIFSALTDNWDGIAHNYNLVTYDGVKWYFSAYDMDKTFGHLGGQFRGVKDSLSLAHIGYLHKLFGLILQYDKELVKERYSELRNDILSEDNVQTEFYNFMSKIPIALKVEDNKTWTGTPATDVNGLNQITNFYRLQCDKIDKEVSNL